MSGRSERGEGIEEGVDLGEGSGLIVMVAAVDGTGIAGERGIYRIQAAQVQDSALSMLWLQILVLGCDLVIRLGDGMGWARRATGLRIAPLFLPQNLHLLSPASQNALGNPGRTCHPLIRGA